ncbi:tetratricopeptide repeat protein [Streptomyces sp. MMG1121]|uniref:tetratricopeptide repeat protein n=1 Tax=Streptomyces sp. MMG1121 TaxID=1415544 RepID=UPI00131D1089|nr:tetratricopeptide repeat protein [Streptomyces sp. MMG1121]
MADHTEGGIETGVAGILLTSGLFLAYQGVSFSAMAYIRRVLGVFENVMGEDHRYTLSSRNALAYAYLSVRDLAWAVPLLERRCGTASGCGTWTIRSQRTSA